MMEFPDPDGRFIERKSSIQKGWDSRPYPGTMPPPGLVKSTVLVKPVNVYVVVTA